MTAALEGGEWSAARPGHTLPPGKTRYLFYRRLGGPQGRSGRADNLVPTGIRSRTVQPLVSRYTDWATRPTTPSTAEDKEKVEFSHCEPPRHVPVLDDLCSVLGCNLTFLSLRGCARRVPHNPRFPRNMWDSVVGDICTVRWCFQITKAMYFIVWNSYGKR